MNGRHGPNNADDWDAADWDADDWDAAALAEPAAEPGVDAILRDDALLDALGRGELPAHYRADVTSRLITDWRQDLGEPDVTERPALSLAPAAGFGAEPRLASLPVLGQEGPFGLDRTFGGASRLAADEAETANLPRYRDEDTGYADETADLPAYQGTDDRIEEPFRRAFVAAGYARPTDASGSGRSGEHDARRRKFGDRGDETTQQLAAAIIGLSDRADEEVDAAAEGAGPVQRHLRRRRLDRIVVAAAAAAAILAAGSAGSVAAAATARPGDTLWPISKVIYADRAHSIEAGEEAHAALTKAKAAAARGDTEAARRYLAQAKQKSQEVRKGSDEEDALQHDMATMDALTDSLSPSPDAGDSADGGAPAGPTQSGQQPRQQSSKGQGQQHHGTKNPGGTTTTQPSAAPGSPQPTEGAPSSGPTEGPPATGPTTTEPTTGEPSTSQSADPEQPTDSASAAQ